MNRGKILSGFAALAIYFSIIFMVLFFYNIHKTKAKNYVEKNSNRVTVTLVNSDKTVFNKSEKKTVSKKPVPQVAPNFIKKPIIKRDMPKKEKRASKPIPKPKRVVPKKIIPKKKVPKKVIPKKIAPKKEIPKKVKKVIPKPPKKNIPKKRVPKKKVPIKKVPKKKVPKKTAKELFSSIKTKRPVIKNRPKHTQATNEPRVARQSSSVKHNMSITDRIKATHQSGRTSNANRDKGVENAYIARVKRHMNNWNPVGMKGQWVTVNLTIYNSGKFKYTISGVNGSMRASLKQYLDTLNRMGLGRHKKSTPYYIQVRFKVR